MEKETTIEFPRREEKQRQNTIDSSNKTLLSTNMQKAPLVSVICICYKHAPYVQQALTSVLNQSYPNIELIVVDDSSPDESCREIESFLSAHPDIPFLALKENVGNCKAFNLGLQKASGKYVIDLAADDLLRPDRIAIGVKDMEAAGEEFGVHFGNAMLIDEYSTFMAHHFSLDDSGKIKEEVPQGDVYQELLKRYFVCTPTMMMRMSILQELGGYDENLAYEDFDFWVRSARNYKYFFSANVLVEKRHLKDSLSALQYSPNSQQLWSTYKVCEKIAKLNRSKVEDKALAIRLRYELRQALLSKNLKVSAKMLDLLCQINGRGGQELFYRALLNYRFCLSLFLVMSKLLRLLRR